MSSTPISSGPAVFAHWRADRVGRLRAVPRGRRRAGGRCAALARRARRRPAFPAFYRVVWNTHVAEFTDLSQADRSECMAAVAAVERALRERLRADQGQPGVVRQRRAAPALARRRALRVGQPLSAAAWAAAGRPGVADAAQRLGLPLEALDAAVRAALSPQPAPGEPLDSPPLALRPSAGAVPGTPWPALDPPHRSPPRSSFTSSRACSRSRFADGARFRIPFELMRVYSPSAEVQGHGPGQEVLQTGKRDGDAASRSSRSATTPCSRGFPTATTPASYLGLPLLPRLAAGRAVAQSTRSGSPPPASRAMSPRRLRRRPRRCGRGGDQAAAHRGAQRNSATARGAA